MSSGKIDDWALHAYVDNEMSPEQRAEFEELLRADPERAAQAASWQRQRDLLKQTYDRVLDEPIPPSLAATLRTGGGLAARPYLAMAAAVLLLLLGGVSGWLLRADTASVQTADIARDALTAYQVYAVEVRHPVEVGSDEKAHLQAWLSKRVGTPFTVPDLGAEGYTLLGGRLLAAEGKPAALLMYEDQSSNRISILLAAQDKPVESGLGVEQRGGLIACYWRDGHLAFAVAGHMERDPMMKLAKVIYDKFEG
jgi:anti-sigma factor RsiW